ncbi:cupin-like domain-containing protein [Chryseobacterium indologenes]|uniref:Cupin-like domain-containing protein n=1 Tax=Chryseobacterium indologenes TaxID=253 RepID=A0A1Z3W6T4_CHRID|nr:MULTISPECIES: cupin-like domain-containing protein [Chryseobacterium]ASE63237.1 cupin-like domain-containing protein [Chryseobacterium indologenes]ATN07146.1 cupin-like domain-containing protein [Chryseobacterium indologenes]AYY84106.1 cupin-like domain-containing protein [Chryseobacterium indologenes]AYZ37853.1 cupin-like domain-containing protein [Chryseobacterium indologenes]AZB18946.1 cupin-like domain-containing protein [Chryseobacterium indologenes]
MGINLKPIDVVDDISKEEFFEKYLKPRRPVVIRNMAKNWPAYQKWTMEYMKEVVGDVEVPLYDSSKADPAAPINASAAKMKFGDYIDLIQREPTDLRIFLFDPIKYAPKLLEDYIAPKELMGGFLDKYPNMFFGGKGSVTFLHFDIDMAHIFHTHFNGRKHILLFDYKWRERLYQIPYATYALEDYDIENPDFTKFPALDGVEGIECFLEHGDTLFMPTGWWHWMKYLDGSFSISLRAWDKSWAVKAHSLWNLTVQRKFDDVMKSNFKGKYMEWKEKMAIKRAEIALQRGLPR